MEKHFTASVYIVSKIKGIRCVLLHKHKKLDLWLPIGGHIESGETPIETLIREVKEETNLDLILSRPKRKLLKTDNVAELHKPISILEENIPQYERVKAHKHLDLIYVGRVKNPNKIKMKEEYNWFSEKELDKLVLGKEVGLPTEVKYLSKKVLNLNTSVI